MHNILLVVVIFMYNFLTIFKAAACHRPNFSLLISLPQVCCCCCYCCNVCIDCCNSSDCCYHFCCRSFALCSNECVIWTPPACACLRGRLRLRGCHNVVASTQVHFAYCGCCRICRAIIIVNFLQLFAYRAHWYAPIIRQPSSEALQQSA